MKSIKTLQEEVKKSEGRLAGITPDRTAATERLETARHRHSQVESQITGLRKERQDILADGGDPEDLNARLNEIRKSDELLEDEIEGLTNKVAGLDKEKEDLKAKVLDLKKTLFREARMRPLVEEYNRRAAALAETLEKIDGEFHIYMSAYGATGRKVIASGENVPYHGIQRIPALWMFEEAPLPEYYDRRTVLDRLQAAERELKSREKYPVCKCFLCQEYAGTDQFLAVRCRRLPGNVVPQDILLGRVPQKHTVEFDRCSFRPREN